MFKQAGISLVETMIGLSIAAGISLVLMRQQETSNQMQAKTSADQNINSAVNIIQTSLANRAICTKTIENKGVGDSLTLIVDAINVDPNTPDIFIVKGVIADTTNFLPGNVKIDSMEIIERGPVGNKKDYLRVMFNRNASDKKKLLGAKTIPKDFRLQGIKVAGKYTLCYSEAANLVENAVQQSCVSMGAQWDTSVTPARCKLTNLPNCILSNEACRGVFAINRGVWNMKAFTFAGRTCTMYYKKDSIVCSGSFTRTCPCWTPGCTCNDNFGQVDCFRRQDRGCADNPLIESLNPVNRCCQI